MASSFDPASGFVQFSLGVAASDQFRRLLTSTGVPFAVLAVGVRRRAGRTADAPRPSSPPLAPSPTRPRRCGWVWRTTRGWRRRWCCWRYG